jgi:hypothetical protein
MLQAYSKQEVTVNCNNGNINRRVSQTQLQYYINPLALEFSFKF